jgi:hypothetical protein
MRRTLVIAVALCGLAAAGPARAWVREGQAAPDFTKSTLAGGPPWTSGPAVSLSSFAGKVVVLFLLGCT